MSICFEVSRDFFMQTGEVQTVNSEDFPRKQVASGKGTLYNNLFGLQLSFYALSQCAHLFLKNVFEVK